MTGWLGPRLPSIDGKRGLDPNSAQPITSDLESSHKYSLVKRCEHG